MQEWLDWESGDALVAGPKGSIERDAVLRLLATEFSRVEIDWHEGDRWATARITKATEIGYPAPLLDAEHSLLGESVLVSLASEPDPTTKVQFYLTPDTATIELHYEPENESAARPLATQLAELLGYEFLTADD